MQHGQTTKQLAKKIAEMDYAPYTPEEVRQRMGISTMSLMADSDPNLGVDEQALRRAVEVGACKIEIGADYGPSHFPYHDPAAIRELKKLYKDCGAEIYSIHSPYGHDPLQWDLEDCKRLIETMAAVGAKVLLLHCLVWGKKQWGPAVEVMNHLVRLCRPHDIWLSIETDLDMTHDANFADWFEFPQVGICCDTGHTGAFFGGLNILEMRYNALRCMTTSVGKLNHLHLSDVSVEPRARPHATQELRPRRDHWPPGQGSSHWQGFMLPIKAMNYPGAFIFEIWTEDPQRFEKLATFPERLAVGELGKYEA